MKGQQTYVDHGPAKPTKIASIRVTDVRCSRDRTRATIYGTAAVNGAGPRAFQVDVTDQGQPGKADTYRIRAGAYDSGSARLGGGNVQIAK